jgi:hypothetical protein
MDKRQSVIESIQKLLALNVSDNEIAENLFDVGISKDEATSLIIEAKGVKPTPVQTQGTFTVGADNSENNSIVQNNLQPETNSSINKNSPIKNNSPTKSNSAFSNNSSSPSVGQNKNLTQKSSKAVFDETVTKLSMNDEVISQIPFNKQKNESNSSPKLSAAQKEANDGRIISDVANQSGVNEVSENGGDSGDEEDSEDEKVSEDSAINTIDKDESELTDSNNQVAQEVESESGSKNLVNSNLTTASSVNDESDEDEFENKVKQTLASAKKQNFSSPTNNKNVNLNSSPLSSKMNSISEKFSSSQKYSPSISLDSSPDFEELWKKGIVVAVNAKLGEMKQLKNDIDSEISQKVDEALRKELYQFKVLNESQKDLLISSNREALDQKQKEITFIIDAKIAELKQYNKQLSETLRIIEESKKQQEASLAEITLALSEAKKTKAQLIVEVNSEMIKTKSQAQSFIDSASLQIQQMDERVNKTLELEKNIAEGMLNQAEQKIEQLTISRADELISKMEVELNKLQSASKKISPELLDQKIQTIEKFKQDFILNMQTNLNQINSAINELNKKNEIAQSTFEEKTLAIDAKMEELTKFENQFTKIMDTILSKQ